MRRYQTELEKRQKKTIPIGYNLRNDVCKGGQHGFIKIARVFSPRDVDIIADNSISRKWKYYQVDYKTGKVIKRSKSMTSIWKVKKKKNKRRRK